MNAPSLSEMFTGQLLEGRYRMVRLLAEGNFGGVFHARLEIFGESVRDVAVKISKTTGLTRESAKSVFGEAILLAKIYDQIPDATAREYIVPVHDLGILKEHESRGFVVMGLICDPSSDEKPRTLDHEISGYSSGMPWRAALSRFTQICTGMAAVHRLNVVHRDLKPDNILLTPGGKIRIVDFGLAAGLNDVGVAEGSVGTYQYMAPETAERGRSDARSDVYSLGIILYEMLTGAHPFRHIQAPSSIMDDHERHEWSIARRRTMDFMPGRECGAVPVWLDRMVARCLRHVPAERYAGAHELLEAVREESETGGSVIDGLSLPQLESHVRALDSGDEAWFEAAKALLLRHIEAGHVAEADRVLKELEAGLAPFVRSTADRLRFYEELEHAFARQPRMTILLAHCRDRLGSIRQRMMQIR